MEHEPKHRTREFSSPGSDAGGGDTDDQQSRSRLSRASGRSVSQLTPAQLNRKRKNDRDAQRSIRMRTKEHIETLERRVKELESTPGHEQLTAAARANKHLEQENMVLRARLQELGQPVSEAFDQRQASECYSSLVVLQFANLQKAGSLLAKDDWQMQRHVENTLTLLAAWTTSMRRPSMSTDVQYGQVQTLQSIPAISPSAETISQHSFRQLADAQPWHHGHSHGHGADPSYASSSGHVKQEDVATAAGQNPHESGDYLPWASVRGQQQHHHQQPQHPPPPPQQQQQHQQHHHHQTHRMHNSGDAQQQQQQQPHQQHYPSQQHAAFVLPGQASVPAHVQYGGHFTQPTNPAPLQPVLQPAPRYSGSDAAARYGPLSQEYLGPHTQTPSPNPLEHAASSSQQSHQSRRRQLSHPHPRDVARQQQLQGHQAPGHQPQSQQQQQDEDTSNQARLPHGQLYYP